MTSDLRKWGPYCVKCGHPASYHGKSFCQVEAGSGHKRHKRQCDCDGYLSAALDRLEEVRRD